MKYLSIPSSVLLYIIFNLCCSGYYWIDPNQGSPGDAMRVLCNFTTEHSTTCVFPTKKVIFISNESTIVVYIQ